MTQLVDWFSSSYVVHCATWLIHFLFLNVVPYGAVQLVHVRTVLGQLGWFFFSDIGDNFQLLGWCKHSRIQGTAWTSHAKLKVIIKYDIWMAEMKNMVMIGGDTLLWISVDTVSRVDSLRTLSHFTSILVNMYCVQWGRWTQGTCGLHFQPRALLSRVSEECCLNLNRGRRD